MATLTLSVAFGDHDCTRPIIDCRAQIEVEQEKTRKRLTIPVHADLQSELVAVPRAAVTILQTPRVCRGPRMGSKRAGVRRLLARSPISSDQAPVWHLRPIREARLVFHDLRKSAVVFLLEAGCSDAEVASITGQSRQMVEHYARRVSQRKLAAAAILTWKRAGNGGLQN